MIIQEHFQFIKLIGGKMHFGGIVIEVEKTTIAPNKKSGEVLISFDREEIPYKEAVMFGVTYYFTHYSAQNPTTDLYINVKTVRDMLMDTSEMIISYVTIMALSRALGFDIRGFELDVNTGMVSFFSPNE